MATLSTRPRHGSAFWPVTIVAAFLLIAVIVVAVFAALNPAFGDTLYIAWTWATGHGSFSPQ